MAHPYVRSALKRYKECDWAKASLGERSIFFPMEIYSELVTMLEKIDIEFMVYLYADETEEGNWQVTRTYIPKQEVSAVSCLALEQVLDVQGIFHSHNTMASFMSGTDDAHINMNHAFSVVGNKEWKFEAITREQLPCGAVHFVKAKLVLCDPYKHAHLDAIIKEKIQEKVYQKTVTTVTKTNYGVKTITSIPETPASPVGAISVSGEIDTNTTDPRYQADEPVKPSHHTPPKKDKPYEGTEP